VRLVVNTVRFVAENPQHRFAKKFNVSFKNVFRAVAWFFAAEACSGDDDSAVVFSQRKQMPD